MIFGELVLDFSGLGGLLSEMREGGDFYFVSKFFFIGFFGWLEG